MIPPWVSGLVSLLLGVGALAVIIADDADPTWPLSTGSIALLGALAGGLAGWQIDSPRAAKALPPEQP
jgi:hypothetical protein